MKPAKRNFLYYLEDMQSSKNNILLFTKDMSYEDYLHDIKTRHAVERNFEIIGEAAKNIPAQLRNAYPMIPWVAMNKFRNIATHEYFGIDNEIVWDIIENKLPQNLLDLQEIIKEVGK